MYLIQHLITEKYVYVCVRMNLTCPSDILYLYNFARAFFRLSSKKTKREGEGHHRLRYTYAAPNY